jgi:hypothetical protein
MCLGERKIPNPKIQIPKQFQTSSSEGGASLQTIPGSHRFGVWNLKFLWSLEFGIWSLLRHLRLRAGP